MTVQCFHLRPAAVFLLEFVKRTCSWLMVVIEASCSVVLEIGKITCSWLWVFIEARYEVILGRYSERCKDGM